MPAQSTAPSPFELRRPWAAVQREPALVAIPLAVALSFALDLTAVEQGPVLCVSRLLFGLPCGGCGLTRGYVALAHGQWLGAIRFNPLTPFLYLWMVGWWGAAVVQLRRGWLPPTSPRWVGVIAMGGIGLLWISRTITFFASADWPQAMARDALALRLWRWLAGDAG